MVNYIFTLQVESVINQLSYC